MCELLGMCFNKSVNASFSFQGFSRRGYNNPDGWGLGFYPENQYAAQVFKEPRRAGDSPLADFLKTYHYVHSSIFVSHVRYATSETSFENTHPFVRVLGGREYIFAHNGFLGGNYTRNLELGRWNPIGTTDSEFAFCYLMNVIESKIPDWNEEAFQILHTAMKEVNQYGNFNCILSDGDYLFCYHDRNGYKGLRYTERKAPFHNVVFRDDTGGINLADTKSDDEAGYVIATNQLTNEKWTDFEPGGLIAFSRGKIIYPLQTKDDRVLALEFIRRSTHRVSFLEIGNAVGRRDESLKFLIQELRALGYIRQDSRDTVGEDDLNATYYTVAEKRSEIDNIIASTNRRHD